MTHPDLENRFLPPQNWIHSDFVNSKTQHHIHFQYGLPEGEVKGIIVALPGLSEFGEKYYETAQFFIDHGYGFYVIDWAYQGRSSRLKDNAHKRHSDGYDADINDLKHMIENHIPLDQPLYMLGHSMGAHIGLRFLIQYPDYFQAASFSAAMIGIADLKNRGWLVYALKPFFNIFNRSYIPTGKDWQESSRLSDGSGIFSSDTERDKIHNIWCLYHPELQVGNPTIRWILESLASYRFLKKNIRNINISILFSTAGKEELVDNKAIQKAVEEMPKAQLLHLEKSKHEILMETDDIRDQFLNRTLDLFTRSI